MKGIILLWMMLSASMLYAQSPRRPVPEWLRNAVVYQVYPQSFNDSDGDGIGDLCGITAKLDYIRSLGVSAVWINPFFVSPFNDGGYDVADYYQVAPRYGTHEDFKNLCAEAEKLCQFRTINMQVDYEVSA